MRVKESEWIRDIIILTPSSMGPPIMKIDNLDWGQEGNKSTFGESVLFYNYKTLPCAQNEDE